MSDEPLETTLHESVTTIKQWTGNAFCPYCHGLNEFHDEKMGNFPECQHCKKRFVARRT